MLIHLTYISIILILLAYILIPKIAKAIRENDECMASDWDDTDLHCWTDGDCCRCPECTERFIKELKEDLK